MVGGEGVLGGRDESGARSLSVSRAYSQGAGAYNPNANHPVGRSQMRQQAPSSLIPEGQTALKILLWIPIRRRQRSMLSQRYALSCKSRAPDQRP